MTSAATSLSGLLTGNGSAIVHTFVYHHPVPQQPPASLADLVEAEHDDASGAGPVVDWHLSLRNLLAHRDEHVHDVWSTFAAWRRTYVAERVIGDLATVNAFLDWADRVSDVSALHALRLPKTRIDAKIAPKVAWQVHKAADECRQRKEIGLGVSVPQRNGLVRGFVIHTEPTLLLADRGAEVYVVADGLELVDPTATDTPARMTVHGWLVDGNGVTAISDEGPIHLGNARGGRLLTQVAPGCAQASVGPAPLSAIFTPLFTGLSESANLAAADHVPLYVRTGPGLH